MNDDDRDEYDGCGDYVIPLDVDVHPDNVIVIINGHSYRLAPDVG
jgi:hypothetical protein